MKHREATPRDIKDFERIAAEPKTAEVMESLGQQRSEEHTSELQSLTNLVCLTGGCRLNRNGHVLEACLGCLRIDLLKPLGCRLIVPMTLNEVLDLCQRVDCRGVRRFFATVRIRCSSAALFDAYTSHC